MSVSDGITATCKAWDCLYQPVADRIVILRSLPSRATELSRESKALGELKDDVAARIRGLLESDRRLEQSSEAIGWLSSVETLLDSCTGFRTKFEARPSNCMGFGCYKNYELAKEAEDLLKQARDFKEQGSNFSADRLANQAPEMVFLLKTLHATVESLSGKKTTVENLMADLKARLKHSVSQSGGTRECSKRAAEWFQTAESSIARSARTIETTASTSLSPCGNTTPSSSCRSYEEACAACKEKYTQGKEVEELLKQLESLEQAGRGFTEEQLIVPVPEMVVVLRSLEANAENLSRKLRMLRSLRADKNARVKFLVSQRQGMQRSEEATDWFEELDSIIESSSRAIARSGSYRCTKINSNASSSSSSCCSSAPEACDACLRGFELGKEMIGLLRDGGRLREHGRSFTDDQLVVAELPASRLEIPIYFKVVGQKKELDDALRFIDDASGVGGDVVGIWGMGGCGKTTLLKRINNHFCSRTMDGCVFDVVLYATAGRDRSVAKMQKVIGKRLGLSLSGGAEEEQALQIFRSLQSVNFLLLLDDLWEEMDLEALGVPPLNSNTQKKRKMVITSRNADVCSRMGTPKRCLIAVGMLSGKESWQVFCECVGNEELLQDPRISQLAKEVAAECGRLPLALVTVGKAMAGATGEHEWRNAMSELRESTHQDMNSKVLSQLKFSFERLKNDVMREIMFFCQDFIGKNGAVVTSVIASLIVGEGLLDGVCHESDLASAHDKAQTLIVSLVKSGLLMWSGRKRLRVTLHDCVCDMLAWLMETQQDKHPQMVRWPSSLDDCSTGRHLQLFFQRWEHARRISMNGSQLKEIPENIEIPSCSHLLNLSWINGKIVHLPEKFLYRMPFLRILILTGLDIDEVPPSIGSLCNLKLLSLDSTNISRLPIQIGDLQQLSELDLSHTSKLMDIPYESISRLLRLELLATLRSAFRWTWDNNDNFSNGGDHGNRNFGLQDLHELSKLGVLTKIYFSLEIFDRDDINRLADSPILLCSIVGLDLKNSCLDMGEQIAFVITKMDRLVHLALQNLDLSMLEKESFLVSTQQQGLLEDFKGHGSPCILPALEHLSILNCLHLSNLKWTWHIPRLQTLRVFFGQNLNSLFPSKGKLLEHGNARPFTSLRGLYLKFCPQLNCISESPLLFPYLEKLIVRDCPELRSLHLDKDIAPMLRKIEGSKEWWNNLVWESEDVKSRLLHCYFQQE